MNAVGGPDITPDWETWQEEIPCPRCGYDLRMLAQPRCPECGLRSTWRELTARRICEERTGLFEYWWRRRPIRSLASTLWRCMFPWLLWPRIPIVARPRVGPLLALVLFTVLLNLVFGIASRATWKYASLRPFGRPPWPTGWARVWDTVWGGAYDALQVAGVVLTVAMLILLGMFAFRQSMRRFQVHTAHVLRVAALSWCGFALWTMVVTYPSYCVVVLLWPIPTPLELLLAVRDVLPLGCLVLSISLGWSVYLKVRHGWAVGPLVVVMAGLAMFVIVFLYTFESAASLNNRLLDLVGDLWPGATRVCQYLFLRIAF